MQTLSLPSSLLNGFGCRHPIRRRAWAALLALALVLAAFMHVAHTHDADRPASYKFCSFCTTLDRGSAPPPAVYLRVPPAPASDAPVQRVLPAPAGNVARATHHARAPPSALQA